ncbi:UNKNOWN [Stylonychia lemnae]|uniref:Uncharacterized protein n=1 Tax=Stylonychia lemnae TaxID=5949 RepID=A0A078B3E5_STYLE|nr:UNKNOWN [Stylonychia lemnae]|eukprot:CDW88964.1 UNKNOWN [Stylonychia lemnae]
MNLMQNLKLQGIATNHAIIPPLPTGNLPTSNNKIEDYRCQLSLSISTFRKSQHGRLADNNGHSAGNNNDINHHLVNNGVVGPPSVTSNHKILHQNALVNHSHLSNYDTNKRNENLLKVKFDSLLNKKLDDDFLDIGIINNNNTTNRSSILGGRISKQVNRRFSDSVDLNLIKEARKSRLNSQGQRQKTQLKQLKRKWQSSIEPESPGDILNPTVPKVMYGNKKHSRIKSLCPGGEDSKRYMSHQGQQKQYKLQSKLLSYAKLPAAIANKVNIQDNFFAAVVNITVQKENQRIVELKQRERENYNSLEQFYVRTLQQIKKEHSEEVEEIYSILSDMSKDSMQLKEENDDMSLRYRRILEEHQRLLDKYDQINNLVNSKDENILVKIMEFEQKIRELESQIIVSEKEKERLAQDVEYYKIKSEKRFKKLITYERKYFNVDIDVLHQKVNFFQSKFELTKYKIAQFISKFGDQLPLTAYFESREYKLLEKAIDEGAMFDPTDVQNLMGDNLLQQQNKEIYDVSVERQDYEDQIKQHNILFENSF